MNIRKIMIYAELRSDSTVNSVAYELLTKARSLFGNEANIAFIVIGNGIAGIVKDLTRSGIDAIFCMDDSRLEIYHTEYFAAAISSAVKEFCPDVLFIGATAAGEEIAPTLGSRFNTGVASHCVDLQIKDDVFVQMVPAFGGKVIGEIYIPNHSPQIVSVKPGIFRAETESPRECKVVDLTPGVLDEVNTSITVTGAMQMVFEGIPVESAEVIVCGGYGLGNQQNWDKLERLASLLNAAVGCTRPVFDNGWVKEERGMIGTSCKSVRPKVYIGFGISGAAHHVCGIKDAGLIISVNRDKDAEIFSASDYKVVVDGTAVIDELIRILE